MTYNATDFDFSAFINSPLANEGALPNDTGDGIAEQASAMMAASLMDTRSNTVDALFGDTSGASQTHDADVNNYGANFGQDASHSTVGNHANGAHIDGHVEQQQQQQVYTGWDGYDRTQMSAPPQAPSYANDGATVPQPQAEGSTLPSVPEAQLNSRAMAYSARVAAHHSEKLRAVMPAMANYRGPTGGSIGGLPASLGLPGQRSHGGSISSSTVPMSHTAQRALAASKPILTLQERRRNSRRAQAQINKSAAARSQRSAAQVRSPTSADSGVNNSGRHAKRGMTTTSGHIHSPASTDASRQQDVRASASQHQNTHSAMTGIEQQLDEKPVVNEEQQVDVHGHEHAQGPSALAKRGSTDRAQPVPVSRQVYSSSGFDMIGALARVVLRPNPRIALGPVDMSCSFTVCDARHPEQPIVYCSDTFCKLTGYSRQEIIGRNCRFLQSPDGRVEPGAERFHTDNAAVAHLKQHSRALQECQASLINYRKNGTPFINLVTVIPIAWDAGDDPAYLVGFQVDLVEQPSAVLERAVDGSYVVNYSTTEDFHSRVAPAEQPAPPPRDYEQEAAQREVAVGKDILDIVSGGKDDTNRWARIMLQHSQDLIHVLSLKGTFLYVSPSIERLLGWKPEELIGKSISEFCHPSDVVPVFRELKDSTSNASINAAAKRSFRSEGVSNRATKGGVGQGGPEVGLLMRMKHKDGSFAWVESKGKLHLEQGKGRKVVISSGRTRPVYNLPWAPVKETVGGMEPSFWAKVSSDGLVLSASEGVSSVIDGADSSALYGKHLQQMVNNEAMPALLECLRGVQVMTVTHKMWNIVDEPVWVTSTLFPSAVIPGTHVVPAVFMKVSLAKRESKSKKNIAETKAFAGKSGYDDEQPEEGSVPSSSVFGELSTQRSSSHIYELHSLKHANRRLKEEVRAAQRRLGSKTGVNEWDQHHGALHPSRPTAPLKEDFVEALNQKSKGHGSHLLAPPMRSSSSSTPSGSNGHSSGEQSSLFEAVTSGGSGSDETAPTTATSSGNASDSSGSDGKKGF